MMKHSNLHTHTLFSDGVNTAEEMVERALELDFSSLGFSDHSATEFDPDYCMKREQYRAYRETVAELKKRYEGRIPLFCGIEKDFFSPVDLPDYDYVIGSVHYILVGGEYYSIDGSAARQMDFIQRVARGDKMELAKRYYDAVVEHAQTVPFAIQGHFDLVTKFGFFDDEGEAYRRIALEALDEVIKWVPFFEVNSGAIARGYRKEPYPEYFLLQHLCTKGAKLILSSDCHKKEFLDLNFDAEVKTLKEIGFSSLWQKGKDGFFEVLI